MQTAIRKRGRKQLKKAVLFFSFAFAALVADQWTKDYMWNVVFAKRGYLVEVTSWLNWRYAENTGMAWSLFSDYPEYLLVITSLISIGVIIVAFKTSRSVRVLLCWALIVGGAFGNIWDRLSSLSGTQRMAVRDFIDIHWNNYHWPTFNLADSFICIGASYLFLYSFSEESKAHD